MRFLTIALTLAATACILTDARSLPKRQDKVSTCQELRAGFEALSFGIGGDFQYVKEAVLYVNMGDDSVQPTLDGMETEKETIQTAIEGGKTEDPVARDRIDIIVKTSEALLATLEEKKDEWQIDGLVAFDDLVQNLGAIKHFATEYRDKNCANPKA
ncbi:hypothetical protein BGX29_007816 [Mortierella sp. GBA35]|nr:hypothetical protein BGX29_007816 [Mortierella sp. GBA35]